ncbi:glycosyltransferase family 4 protein [Myxosarcina sp. GI1]|uniref:glycosyltransferase family 4 protein n=1 Tax=Myxosarcina sp. GI1 TaxID=1541065 RepID=UPI0006899CF0|nr:glycosyltransferase family 4 protein [Myxosarcina sp. GI1]
MKIAVVGVKGIPANQGGIEHYCQELYKNITSRGNTVELYARSNYTKQNSFSSYYCHGVKVISLPSMPWQSFDALLNSFIAAVAATFVRYDIVHFHALGPSLFCWIPRWFSSAKIVVTCHGLDWQRSKWSKLGSSIIYAGERAAVSYAHKLIVVSKYLETYFQQKYELETTYIPTAPALYAKSNLISYTDSLKLKTKKYILFLGRLVPEKRPDLLLEAFKLLDPPNWKLVFVGDTSGTDSFKLKLLSKKNEKIIFTNTLTGTPLADIVRNAGLFVLPSDLEGLPLVMLEAMREGIPVLASDIPPHCQLISKDRGLLFKAGNIHSLVSNLEKALSQPAELNTKAQRAKEYVVNNYSWEKVSYENLMLYVKLSKLLTNNNWQKKSGDRYKQKEHVSRNK